MMLLFTHYQTQAQKWIEFRLGKADSYGIIHIGSKDKSSEQTIEGIIKNGDISYMDGPYIQTSSESIWIIGKYNRHTKYYPKDFMETTIYADYTEKNPVQKIFYQQTDDNTINYTYTPYRNGKEDYDRQQRQSFSGNISNLIQKELSDARNAIVGFSMDTLKKAELLLNNLKSMSSESIKKKVQDYKLKKSFSSDDCEKLYFLIEQAEKVNLLQEAIFFSTLYINNNCRYLSSSDHSLRKRAELYQKNKQYLPAISDYKKLEILYKNQNESISYAYAISNIKECYKLLNDKNNLQLYTQKYNAYTKTQEDELNNNNTNVQASSTKKFCYATSMYKYELTMEEGSTNKVYYKLYNSNGKLEKTIQGIWTMRNDGVYGNAYNLTIEWTGANSSMSDLKFNCRFYANGQIQSLTDNQKRVWEQCFN